MKKGIALPLIIIAGAILVILLVLQHRAQRERVSNLEFTKAAGEFDRLMIEKNTENSQRRIRDLDASSFSAYETQMLKDRDTAVDRHFKNRVEELNNRFKNH